MAGRSQPLPPRPALPCSDNRLNWPDLTKKSLKAVQVGGAREMRGRVGKKGVLPGRSAAPPAAPPLRVAPGPHPPTHQLSVSAPPLLQRLKVLPEYLRQHCEDAVRPHLDCIVGA